MIIWISGLSGSGKSYLANQIITKFSKLKFINLDGDHVRKSFKINKLNLGYSVTDRKIQVNRLKSIAKILQDQKLNVIVTAVYITNAIIISNRRLFKNYLHIHLEKNIDDLILKNNKKIYSKKNVIGKDLKENKINNYDIKYNKFLKRIDLNNLIKKIKKI